MINEKKEKSCCVSTPDGKHGTSAERHVPGRDTIYLSHDQGVVGTELCADRCHHADQSDYLIASAADGGLLLRQAPQALRSGGRHVFYAGRPATVVHGRQLCFGSMLGSLCGYRLFCASPGVFEDCPDGIGRCQGHGAKHLPDRRQHGAGRGACDGGSGCGAPRAGQHPLVRTTGCGGNLGAGKDWQLVQQAAGTLRTEQE